MKREHPDSMPKTVANAHIFPLGIEIERLRKSKGLTQKQVYDGICGRDVFFRYKTGQRRPNWYTFEKILERLGENPRSYFHGYSLTPEDREFIKLRNDLKFLLRKKTPESASAAEAVICKLQVLVSEQNSSDVSMDDDMDVPHENEQINRRNLNQQFLLRAKATLAYNRGDYAAMLKFSQSGIQITKPYFDPKQISKYVLFFDEIILINHIAVALFHTCSIQVSTDMLLQLKTSMSKGYFDEDGTCRAYMSILFNITNNLGMLRKYTECHSLCDEGVELCIKHENSHFHPLFLFNKSCCLFAMGEKEQGISVFKDAYALLVGAKRFAEYEAMTKIISEQYGIIDISAYSATS